MRFAPGVRSGTALILGLGVALLTFASYPRQLSAHPLRAGVQEQKFEDGVIHDAQYHRLKLDLDFSPWSTATDHHGRVVRAHVQALQGERLIHLDGLTDAFLAHMSVNAWRPGHKSKCLKRLGFELSQIQNARGWGPGVHWAAVEAVEARIYNRHDFWANLGLALESPPVIEVEVSRGE